MLDLGAAVLVAQHEQQAHFAIRPGGPVGMAALRRDRPQAPIDAMQIRLTEPGARRDDGGVSIAA